MAAVNPHIEEGWKEALYKDFNSDYFSDLKHFLIREKSLYAVYPPGPDIFSAFDHTPFHKVKAVILGQDPYHGKGQANGLCFSVHRDVQKPPSLQNIFRELHDDLGCTIPDHGDLGKWAREGVLLLNAILTVRANQAGSHRNKGWEQFTDSAIQALAENRQHIVFILWGNYARAKAGMIDNEKHHIIESPHPSPFSADRGFFGSKPFSGTNDYLNSKGVDPIDWDLTE